MVQDSAGPKLASWRLFVKKGSDAQLIAGNAATAAHNRGCPRFWFSGATTIILGGAEVSPDLQTDPSETAAQWNIQVDPQSIHRFSQAFLIVACIRYFGGLHTDQYDTRADIFLNAQPIDGFALCVRPPQHTDYFHRPPLPEIPRISPISGCQTVYAWSLLKHVLNETGDQQVRIRIDHAVRWDIDYLGVLIQTKNNEPKVFLSYSWTDEIIAKKLVESLEDRSIHVWIDRATILLGDRVWAEIQRAIEQVQYVIVLLSKESVKSKWVLDELRHALKTETNTGQSRVLPVVLEDCDIPPELDERLLGQLRSVNDVEKLCAMIETRFAKLFPE